MRRARSHLMNTKTRTHLATRRRNQRKSTASAINARNSAFRRIHFTAQEVKDHE